MKLFEPEAILRFLPKLLTALPVTLGIVLIASAAGLLLGLLLALSRVERLPVLSQLAAVMVSFLRGTPVLVQMFIVYYGLPLLLNTVGVNIFSWDKIIFIYITYSLNCAAFFSESIRSAVLAVPKGQRDAAAASGLSRAQAYRRIILPQSAVIALPSVGMTLTGLLQDSSLAFSLGILDVMGRANALGAVTSRVLEAYAAAAILFIALTIVFEQAFRGVQRKLAPQNHIAKGTA
ncbi:MAG: amino acid ABC transporter permease [Oscillospiraceae bacterium]|jgi:L-cystine transport system permease protein|nr:amino acid ABC transporter permease [Oscillospiraceae bacterium]